MIADLFVQEGILSEETLVKWFEHVSKTAESRSADVKEKKAAAAIKESAAAFIEWLKNADSYDSDEYL